jgi:hypothetical protein
MNLIDVLKSGKRFRREGEEFWLDATQDWSFSLESVLADDWEVEGIPKKITVSKDDIRIAAYRAFIKLNPDKAGYVPSMEFVHAILKELKL